MTWWRILRCWWRTGHSVWGAHTRGIHGERVQLEWCLWCPWARRVDGEIVDPRRVVGHGRSGVRMTALPPGPELDGWWKRHDGIDGVVRASWHALRDIALRAKCVLRGGHFADAHVHNDGPSFAYCTRCPMARRVGALSEAA